MEWVVQNVEVGAKEKFPDRLTHKELRLRHPDNKLRGLSPPANYTNLATAACRRS
jgi:hypothetical protein